MTSGPSVAHRCSPRAPRCPVGRPRMGVLGAGWAFGGHSLLNKLPAAPFHARPRRDSAGASFSAASLCPGACSQPHILLCNDPLLASEIPFGGKSREKKLSKLLDTCWQRQEVRSAWCFDIRRGKVPPLFLFFLKFSWGLRGSPGTIYVGHFQLDLGFPTVGTRTIASLAQLWDG